MSELGGEWRNGENGGIFWKLRISPDRVRAVWVATWTSIHQHLGIQSGKMYTYDVEM